MTAVRGVHAREVPIYWPKVAPLFERGIAWCAGRWTLEDLCRSFATEQRQLWVTWPALDFALATQILEFPTMKVLSLFWAGGKLPSDWPELLEGIERWAAEKGCKQLEAGGRKGWARRLGGFREAPWRSFVKEISDA